MLVRWWWIGAKGQRQRGRVAQTHVVLGDSLMDVVVIRVTAVVDDTVHFISKYLRARREQGKSPEDAVRYAFQTVGSALITTSIVLILGFGEEKELL